MRRLTSLSFAVLFAAAACSSSASSPSLPAPAASPTPAITPAPTDTAASTPAPTPTPSTTAMPGWTIVSSEADGYAVQVPAGYVLITSAIAKDAAKVSAVKTANPNVAAEIDRQVSVANEKQTFRFAAIAPDDSIVIEYVIDPTVLSSRYTFDDYVAFQERDWSGGDASDKKRVDLPAGVTAYRNRMVRDAQSSLWYFIPSEADVWWIYAPIDATKVTVGDAWKIVDAMAATYRNLKP